MIGYPGVLGAGPPVSFPILQMQDISTSKTSLPPKTDLRAGMRGRVFNLTQEVGGFLVECDSNALVHVYRPTGLEGRPCQQNRRSGFAPFCSLVLSFLPQVPVSLRIGTLLVLSR